MAKKSFIEKLESIATKLGLTEVKFEDVKDNQGNIIRIEDFVVGGKAQLISTDGTLIDLTDGEYTLEDGRTFTIQNGVIASIANDVKADPTTPAEKVQPVAQDAAAPVADATATPADSTITDSATTNTTSATTSGDTSDLEARVATLEDAVQQLMDYITQMADSTSEFKSVKKQLEADKATLAAKINELEQTPAGEPIQVKAAKVERTPAKEQDKSKMNMWNDKVDYAEKYKVFLEYRK